MPVQTIGRWSTDLHSQAVVSCRCGPALAFRTRLIRTRATPESEQGPSSSSNSSRWSRCPDAPWALTFDLRERETEWTEANKARLVALVTAQQLSIPMAEMEERLEELMRLLPDLAGSIPKLQPALLAGLTADLSTITARVLVLRELLPAANVSRVVAERPQLLLQESSELAAAVEALQRLLHLERVDNLVEAQPLLLVTGCVEEVLDDMRRLMPGQQPEQLLAADPDWVLRVQRGQKWLGQNPDSDMGELIDWKPPASSTAGGTGAAAAARSTGADSHPT